MTDDTTQTTSTDTSAPKWGDSFDRLTEDRKQELADRLWDWNPDQATNYRPGPFCREHLNGLEVHWLAACAVVGKDGDVTAAVQLLIERPHMPLSNLHLEQADLSGAQLQGANLSGAQLQGADLGWAYLERADRMGAHLEGATFSWAHLESASLFDAHLERAILSWAHLERASLAATHVQQAILSSAHLEQADLFGAHLERADLRGAHLEGADLRETHLDGHTLLADSHLTYDRGSRDRIGWARRWHLPSTPNEATALGDVHWAGVGNVDLTQIADWDWINRLGDEGGIHWRSDAAQQRRVARAYRQVSTQLRAQGMTEVADRFSHRALVWERRASLRRFRIPQYLGSWLLAILAGYGYRPLYTLFWYLVVLSGFAFAYWHFGPSEGVPFSPLGALVFSVTSFHGRGFFPGSTDARHSLLLDDPITVLAAAEAVIGLLIEISFIATFTQRFFGSK